MAGLKPQETKSVPAVPLRKLLHLLSLPNGRLEPARKEEPAGRAEPLRSVCTLESCQMAGLRPQETKSVPAVPLRRFLHLLGLPNGRLEPPRKEECAGCAVLLRSLCTLEGCQTAGLKPQETKSVPAVPLRRFLHLLGLPNGRLEPPRTEESAGQAEPLRSVCTLESCHMAGLKPQETKSVPAVPLRGFFHPQEKNSVPAVLCCCGACAPLKAAKRQA